LQPPLTDSFLRDVLGVETELQGWSARLMVASSNGDELGWARVSVLLAEMSGEEEEWGSGAYPLCQCTFYSPQKSGDSILCVGSPAVDRVTGEAPPSCLQLGEDDDLSPKR
jgi:hypothetical protein